MRRLKNPPLGFPHNIIEEEFGGAVVALRGKTVRVVALLSGEPDRTAVFLGLLKDEHGDLCAIIEEGEDGFLESVHPSRLQRAL